MRIAALISWVATAGFGLTMLSIWVGRGGIRSSFRRRLTSRRMLVHIVPAVLGLLVWIVFVAHGPAPFGWVALALLAPVGALGFWNFFLWQKRRLGVLRATRSHWDLPPGVAGNEQIPAEQHFPVASVFLHGVLAVATIGLVLLANLGVGTSGDDVIAKTIHDPADRTPPAVALRAPVLQRVSRTRGVTATVVCDERCSAGLAARFATTTGRRRLLLYTRGIADEDSRVTLRSPLTKTARRELARTGELPMRLAVRVCDSSGNCTLLMHRRVLLLP
jgi:hypothetical protein